MRANYLLILGCVFASLWAWSLTDTGTVFVEQNLVFSYNNLMAGRAWTLVTALFVHASLLHLGGNMLFLFVFGNTLEKQIGRQNHLIVFFTGGLTAFLLSVPFFPTDTGMVGASAAIFTLAAAVMLTKPLKFSWLFLAPQGLVAVIYFLYNVLVVFAPSNVSGVDPSVAYMAHILGFTVGVPIGMAFSSGWKKNLVITLGLSGAYFAILLVISILFGPSASGTAGGLSILGLLGHQGS